ncbi:MAG: sensor histidine kinase [Sideroxydans sp.]|nr:sensor histidine kinase [Sideroxydans sp.]
MTLKLFRSRDRLLLVMLGLLHLSLWLGIDNVWSHSLLLIHLGLFLLWQPLWRGEREVRPGGVLFIVCASAVALLWLDWWVLAFWVSGLFALVGGRIFTFRTTWLRLLHLSVMAYLLAVLLLWVVPHLFAVEVATDTVNTLMGVALPLWLASMLLIPLPSEAEQAERTGQVEQAGTVDFIYSLLLFMLLMLLVLGTLTLMSMDHKEYLEALLRTLFFIALVLVALAWVWNPRFGFSGLQPIFSRYLLNVGTPFESWLKQLAETARQEVSPEAFLARATAHLSELPWLSGLAWESGAGNGELGVASRHHIEVREQDLHLTLYCKRAFSPSILLHIHLLTQLLGHFYQAKQREQSLREIARLQAIYETGARLTHDLKNMLQSLFALTSIAQQEQEAARPIFERQLPILTQRIELTLAKLKVPQQEVLSPEVPLNVWWENLRRRHQYENIEWRHDGAITEMLISSAMFDCVADNLIDNARTKRQQQPGIVIQMALDALCPGFRVCDDGMAIPTHMARQLLHTVVQSENGLGVGLYQAARWAAQLGYQITLVENRDGRVCFELTQSLPLAAAQ